MNRKNWISALMAVMMVISMMTCFAVPTVMAEEVDLSNVPSVQSISSAQSGSQQYKIETVEDLIYAAKNYKFYTAGDMIYLASDLDIAAYDGGFAGEFVGFGENHDSNKGTTFMADFDGLGHTIYNYEDTHAIFRAKGGILRNLNIVDATMNAGSTAGALVVAAADALGTTTISNVHIYNSTITAGNVGVAMILGFTNNKPTRHVLIENCSVINSTVETETTTGGSSLVAVRFRDQSGASLTLKNIVVAESTLITPNVTNEGGGLVVADCAGRGNLAILTFDNIAVLNCKLVNLSDSCAGILTVGPKYGGTINATNIFAAGNMRSTNEGASWKKLDRVIDYTSSCTVILGEIRNVVTDVGVTNVVKSAKSGVATIANENQTTGYGAEAALASANIYADVGGYTPWGYDGEGVIVPADAASSFPYQVTFVTQEDTIVLGTDPDGCIVGDEDLLSELETTDWLDALTGEYWVGDIWQVFTESVRLVEDGVCAYRYASTGVDTHKLTCLNSGCSEHPDQEMPCLEDDGALRDPSLDEAEVKYFSPALLGYYCSHCGNSFTAPDPEKEMAPAISFTTDKDIYKAGEAIKLTVSPAVDAGIANYDITVTYDPAILTYADDANANGTVKFTNMSGAFSLNFTAGSNSTEVTMTIDRAVNASAEELDFYAKEVVATIWNSVVPVTEVDNIDTNEFFIETVEDLLFLQTNFRKFARGDMIYLYEDLDITAYDADKDADEKFAKVWTGIGASYSDLFKGEFNGMGHKIIGWTSPAPLFRSIYGGAYGNVTFVDAKVTGLPANMGLFFGGSAYESAATTVSNVHMVNCDVSATGAINGIMIGFMNNRKFDLTLENCSVVGSTLSSSANNVRGTGLLMAEWAGSTAATETLTLNNIVVVGNKLKVNNNGTSSGGGLVIGDNNNNGTKIVFNNILVADNLMQNDNADNATILVGEYYGTGKTITVNNLISLNNKRGTNINSAATLKAITAITSPRKDTKGVYSTEVTAERVTIDAATYVVLGNAATVLDATTRYIDLRGAVALLNDSAAYPWTVDANGLVVVAGEAKIPHAITFKDEDGVTVLAIVGTNPATDKLITNTTLINILKNKAWYNSNGKLVVRKGERSTIWATIGTTENCNYLAVAAANIHNVVYCVTNNNGTHYTTCGDATCAAHRTANVNCERVQDYDAADVLGTYYEYSKEGKTCLDCGGIWTVRGLGVAPVKLVADNTKYPTPNPEISNQVNVDVVLPDDVLVDEVTLKFTYDAAELTFIRFEDYGFDYDLDDTTSGLLIIRFTGIGLQTGELGTLVFETCTDSTVDSGLDLEITRWVAVKNEGENLANILSEVKNVHGSVAFKIYFYRSFTVGDVYGNDDVVDLKDAVVLLQVLSGQRPVDDADFNLEAANVFDPNGADGEGANTVDTSDLARIMKVLTGEITQDDLLDVDDHGGRLPQIIVIEIVVPK